MLLKRACTISLSLSAARCRLTYLQRNLAVVGLMPASRWLRLVPDREVTPVDIIEREGAQVALRY